jgi:ATP-GRASP peptide maturase of grasp-with-spasm system
MLLILTEAFEESTDLVLEWLLHYKIPFFRINQEDKVTLQEMNISNEAFSFSIVVNDAVSIHANEITAFWYRRGFLHTPYSYQQDHFFTDNPQLAKDINQNLYTELQNLKQVLYEYLDNRAHINSFASRNNNKLQHLQLAAGLGLKVPHTLVCTQKANLRSFYEQHPDGIIVKPNSSGFFFKTEEEGITEDYAVYTNCISADDLEVFPDDFFPTLFQQKLSKQFELRIFYLQGKSYAMAIFSQQDKQTELDFRRYNIARPNRNVPFKLPAALQQKIKQFMKQVGLGSGSLDMIYTPEGDYYFLEVNPVGQYGFTGAAGNYPLDQLIALHLKQQYEKEKVS